MSGTADRAFPGFPARGRFTPIHNVFFSSVLPEMDDPAELKVTLYVFRALYQKKGYPRFVTAAELLADPSLAFALNRLGDARQVLDKALAAASRRGTLLELKISQGERSQDLYFLNTDTDRKAVERLRRGEAELPDMPGAAVLPGATPPAEKRNIFALYESSIGMLTPLIAEELKEAERLYPEQWVEEAFREATELNKRSWRYVARVLERWSSEGKDSGKSKRHPQQADPDKYVRGKYGHIVRRR